MTKHDLALLRRYLHATRHECRFVEGPEAAAAASIAARAFPGVEMECSYVLVRSRNRHCEYRSIGSSGFVVLDLELSDRLIELDLLAQISAMKPNWVYAFFIVLLGDVFRRHRDLARYRYCVLKALGDVESLRGLASLPKDGPPIHAAIAPVLLHELAHVAYRKEEVFVGVLRELCRAALTKFAEASADQAATGRPPIGDGATLGVPFEEYDQERLKRQLESYAATIRNNEELEEEVTCDLIAALALVNFEAGINSFDLTARRSMPLSIRQLGDLLYLAIKTSRYLQILTGVQQFGANIVQGSDELHRGMIEMTARTNALTHVLLSLFRVQIDMHAFNDMPDFGRPLSNDDVTVVMQRSIARLMREHHERLLDPFEHLSEFFVTPHAFDEDNRAVLARLSEPAPESLDAVDEVRSALPF